MKAFIEFYEIFLRDFGGLSSVEKGVFNSYDFHISAQGPQLIEINTNAAGALLSLQAQGKIESCCDSVKMQHTFNGAKIIQMFRNEFALRFPQRELKTVAIVDENPKEQFFYREFELVRDLLRANGITALILSPEELTIRKNQVFAESIPIDFIYNRTTDFSLTENNVSTLRLAYEQGLTTVSPNPAVYARYARKSNLVHIRDARFDQAPEIDFLRAHIPETLHVCDANRDSFWQTRKNWFFKPVSGFGGKAVYRGDKLTRRVWDEIAKGDYLAQRFIAPDTRQVTAEISLKYDIRVYTYGSEILGVVARYYQGQTTNFRTEHGGLASVMLAA